MPIESTLVSEPETVTTWKHREEKRFSDGKYIPVPVILDYPKDHFVHLSVTDTEHDYVAYTPSEAYGQADRQVRLKFGRYLKKTWPVLSDQCIQGYVTQLKVKVQVEAKPETTLRFATDRETINRIFETEMQACGSCSTSCMHGKFDEDLVRPYHVYADSPDVAVAYVTVNGDIVSRSVVSTRHNRWVRAYSIRTGDNDTDCGTLKELLKDAGYTWGSLRGNRLTNLQTRKVMLPYLDGDATEVIDQGEYWLVVEEDGEWKADCTDGTATCVDRRDMCERCENHQDFCECIYCECCEESYHQGCDDCSFCSRCDLCTEHDHCECDRCSECNDFTDDCNCSRCRHCNELDSDCACDICSDCDELTEDCECEPDESEPESEPEVKPETDVLTPMEARHKLNRAFIYLRDKYGMNNVQAEFDLMVGLVRLIEREMAA